MPKKLDFRLIAKFDCKKKFEAFIDSLPRYQIGSSNNVLCQLCNGKGHKMKQIYYKCAIASCPNKYKIERLIEPII